MKLILLAGNSVVNRDWIEEVSAAVQDSFETIIHYYRHWETGDEMIDLDYELAALLKDLPEEEDYCIFAKSAGSILTMRGVFEGVLHPEKCVFAGMAINWAKGKDLPIDQWLDAFTPPTLCIQKTNDPACSVEDLKALKEKYSMENLSIREITGEDHHYENVAQLKELIESHLDF